MDGSLNSRIAEALKERRDVYYAGMNYTPGPCEEFSYYVSPTRRAVTSDELNLFINLLFLEKKPDARDCAVLGCAGVTPGALMFTESSVYHNLTQIVVNVFPTQELARSAYRRDAEGAHGTFMNPPEEPGQDRLP